MTCNVRGLANKIKRTKVFRYICEQKVQFACLQETHSTKSKRRIWKNEFRGQVICSHGGANSCRVAILINNDVKCDNLKVDRDDEGRRVEITFEINQVTYRIINLYAPNEPSTENPEFFAKILDNAQACAEDHVIITGNFNQILDIERDRKGGKKSCSTKAADVINAFMEQGDWCDVWRVLHEDAFQFTWKRSQPLIMRRLDYFLTHLGTLGLIDNCTIEPATF